MTPSEFLYELSYPLRSSGVLIALASFLLLASIVVLAVSTVGVFALASVWLAIVLVTALIRYLAFIADARALEREVAPPGVEYFSLVGNLWTLFPAVIVLSTAFLADELRSAGWPFVAVALVAAVAIVFPAMLGVLTITHSPAQSINPAAVARYIGKLGPAYLYALAAAAPATAVALWFRALPIWLAMALGVVAAAAFFSVVGGLARTGGLVDEVGLDEPVEPDAVAETQALARRRTAVLNHAYGFASRGNRAGGLKHVDQWIEREPDPEAARAWFFEHMLAWEDPDPALAFARRWLTDLLAAGEDVRAVKLMLRCRLVEPRFRPEAECADAAAAAAEKCSNPELAAALRRL